MLSRSQRPRERLAKRAVSKMFLIPLPAGRRSNGPRESVVATRGAASPGHLRELIRVSSRRAFGASTTETGASTQPKSSTKALSAADKSPRRDVRSHLPVARIHPADLRRRDGPAHVTAISETVRPRLPARRVEESIVDTPLLPARPPREAPSP
jgi:hypothetical protein